VSLLDRLNASRHPRFWALRRQTLCGEFADHVDSMKPGTYAF
jgi:hypothetical protein